MTFWQARQTLKKWDPQEADVVVGYKLCGVSVRVRVECGVGALVALKSVSRA